MALSNAHAPMLIRTVYRPLKTNDVLERLSDISTSDAVLNVGHARAESLSSSVSNTPQDAPLVTLIEAR